jgi:predicted nucleotidyltransferase component of viral defense system
VYLHDSREVLAEMVAATTKATGIAQGYVYKDYFVSMVLKEIVAVNPDLVFKGGTALSKCYGIIDRFSEDVDLGLEAVKPTQSMRQKTKAAVTSAIRKLGLTIDNLDRAKSRREFNQYQIPLPQIVSGIKPDMLIVETGLMTPAAPVQSGEVMSFIGEYLLTEGRQDVVKEFDLDRFALKVVKMERTFADKVFAVADYYLNGDIPSRQSRHIYDLYKLQQVLSFDANLAKLIDRVRSERVGNHRCLSASPDVSLSDVLKEVYNKQIYRKDYESITMPLLYDKVDYETAASAIPKIIDFLEVTTKQP